MGTHQRCPGFTGAEAGMLRLFDSGTRRLQSFEVAGDRGDDDAGSLLGTPSTPSATDQHIPGSGTSCPPSDVASRRRQICPLFYVLYSLLPSLGIIAALVACTYTSVQSLQMVSSMNKSLLISAFTVGDAVLHLNQEREMTMAYMASHNTHHKSTARRALYFARRRTDRSLSALPAPASLSVWNSLTSHRSSFHSSSTDGALFGQLEFYSEIIYVVSSYSFLPSWSSSVDASSSGAILQLVDAYHILVDCVGYLGAERAACKAFLPLKQLPETVCDRLGHRELFYYARTAFAAEICHRSLGRLAMPEVLTALRLYQEARAGLEPCRRRLLPEVGGAVTPSVADVRKCSRALRLQQLRRLKQRLNKPFSDELESVLDRLERDIDTRLTEARHAAVSRLAAAVVALSASVVYVVVGCACRYRQAWYSHSAMSPARDVTVHTNELDVGEDSSELQGLRLSVACSLTKSTSV